MKVVGLCGQSGSGKGLICSFFNDFNVKCVDTDKIYHEIISVNSTCTAELVNFFGRQILAEQGIDRKELRKVAFASQDNLKKINEITHRHILNVVRSEIIKIKNEGSADGIIVDAPLLFESGFDRECDATIAVIANTDNKVNRITKRDDITSEMAKLRLASQISDEKLAQMCTYIIENNSTAQNLRETVYNIKKTIFDQ